MDVVAPSKDAQRVHVVPSLVLYVSYESPDDKTSITLRDARSAFEQISGLFIWAWALGVPEQLARRAELRSRPIPEGLDPFRQTLARNAWLYRDPPAPTFTDTDLYVVRLESALRLLAEIQPELQVLAGGGGLFVLMRLVERICTLPLQIGAERERLRAERANWRAERAQHELSYIETVGEMLEKRSRLKPHEAAIVYSSEIAEVLADVSVA